MFCQCPTVRPSVCREQVYAISFQANFVTPYGFVDYCYGKNNNPLHFGVDPVQNGHFGPPDIVVGGLMFYHGFFFFLSFFLFLFFAA